MARKPRPAANQRHSTNSTSSRLLAKLLPILLLLLIAYIAHLFFTRSKNTPISSSSPAHTSQPQASISVFQPTGSTTPKKSPPKTILRTLPKSTKPARSIPSKPAPKPIPSGSNSKSNSKSTCSTKPTKSTIHCTNSHPTPGNCYILQIVNGKSQMTPDFCYDPALEEEVGGLVLAPKMGRLEDGELSSYFIGLRGVDGEVCKSIDRAGRKEERKKVGGKKVGKEVKGSIKPPVAKTSTTIKPPSKAVPSTRTTAGLPKDPATKAVIKPAVATNTKKPSSTGPGKTPKKSITVTHTITETRKITTTKKIES